MDLFPFSFVCYLAKAWPYAPIRLQKHGCLYEDHLFSFPGFFFHDTSIVCFLAVKRLQVADLDHMQLLPVPSQGRFPEKFVLSGSGTFARVSFPCQAFLATFLGSPSTLDPCLRDDKQIGQGPCALSAPFIRP